MFKYLNTPYDVIAEDSQGVWFLTGKSCKCGCGHHFSALKGKTKAGLSCKMYRTVFYHLHVLDQLLTIRYSGVKSCCLSNETAICPLSTV